MKPGIYNIKNELIYSWDELINAAVLCRYDNKLTTLYVGRLKDKLILDKGIEIIDEHAFSHTSLRSVECNEELKEIGIAAFNLCYDLEEIKLSDNIEEIKEFTFERCSKLEQIKFPKNLKTIRKGAFKESALNGTLELPTNLENIEEDAFDLTYIEEIIFPKNIKSFGKNCFGNCWFISYAKYPGTREEFEQIDGWENVFSMNSLTIENIEFHKTLEELIDEGKNLREANKILKEQEEQAI